MSYSELQTSNEEKEKAKEEIEHFVKEKGYILPDRGDLDDPSINWRTIKPDYTIVNLNYFKGKTRNHKTDSLEKVNAYFLGFYYLNIFSIKVQNLVVCRFSIF